MKSKLLLLLVFFLLGLAVTKGQSNYEMQIKKGLNLAYNFQLEDAEKVFSRAMQIIPARPEAYHYIAQCHLWGFLGSKDLTELKIFSKWSEMSVEKAEALFNKNPKDYKLNYLLGNIYLLKAMASGADNSTLSAFSSSKTAFSFFEKTLELNPNYFDAYRGLGVFNYALDFIPGVFKWAVSLSGMKADREKGFNLVRTAYRKGIDDRTESAFHLAKMYTDYVAEYDSAQAVLKNLLSQFPDNPLFNYQTAIVLTKAGDLKEAEKYCNKVIRLNHPSVLQMNSLARFVKGDTYYKRNDFVNAAKYYSEFIENSKDIDYTGIANYRLAVCAFINGNTELYKKSLLDAGEGNTDIFEDEYAKRVSQRLNGRGFSKEEILLIKSKNDYDARKYQNTIINLMPVVYSINNADLKAEAFLLLAESSIQLKKLDDAARYIYSADSISVENSEWVIPKSLYLKSLLEYKKGNYKSAISFFEKASDENEYDFKDEISVLLNHLKRKIYKK